MRTGRDQQSLSYPLRLPDEIQADALRLLDASREVINLAVTALWDRLDEFATRTNTYAYKQVEEMIAPPQMHGHRQWRCEAEQAGRILRGQAERKQQFALILPLLEQGMILPEKREHTGGQESEGYSSRLLAEWRDAQTDGGNAVELQSLIEQACNFYLSNGCFPETYEEMQSVPVLKAGLLAVCRRRRAPNGSDLPTLSGSRPENAHARLADSRRDGKWARTWREKTIQMTLPEVVVARAKAGKMQAPSLREIIEADGTRYAVLDFIVEVPVEEQASWEEMQTVLGFDWGVRVLVTASVVDLDGHQWGVPFFWTPARLMADRRAPDARLTNSKPKWLE